MENIGDDNRFSAIHGGAARARLRSDRKAVDGRGVRLGKTRSGAVPHMLPVLIEEQDRTKQAVKSAFHNSNQLLQYFFQRGVAGYHLQDTDLSVTQRLRLLALGYVHQGADDLTDFT